MHQKRGMQERAGLSQHAAMASALNLARLAQSVSRRLAQLLPPFYEQTSGSRCKLACHSSEHVSARV